MNLFARFQRLIPRQPLQAGVVLAHNSDGTSTVELPAGGKVRVMGQSVAVNSHAFIQAGRIVGEAPALTATEIEV